MVSMRTCAFAKTARSAGPWLPPNSKPSLTQLLPYGVAVRRPALCCGSKGWRSLHGTPGPLWGSSRESEETFESSISSSGGAGAYPSPTENTQRRRRFIAYVVVGAVLATASATAVFQRLGPAPDPANNRRFVQYEIVAKEHVSPTAFILTVRPVPQPLHVRLWQAITRGGLGKYTGRDATAAHAHGLWSVEIRQPQLQVAREYTPLPPLESAEEADGEPLRFLIRQVNGGEVSTYLSRLPVGATVDIRGPHLGFDIEGRLGSASQVVFLAGGTGIAPALQVAQKVLELDHGHATRPQARVFIVWASRRAADCIGCPRLSDTNADSRPDADKGNSAAGGAVMTQLAKLQARYPGRLSLRCTVDEEGSFIDRRVMAKGMMLRKDGKRTTDKESSAQCHFHSQKALTLQPAREPREAKCTCVGRDGSSGKNLLCVSGPDGFIEACAGAKRWAGGQELQGPVSGLLKEVVQTFPSFSEDWLVLKL